MYSCFGIFIIFLSNGIVNFTSPLEDDFSGEGHVRPPVKVPDYPAFPMYRMGDGGTRYAEMLFSITSDTQVFRLFPRVSASMAARA